MENRLPLRISLGLILAVMLAFSPVVLCDFVDYDDGDYVYANPHVLSGLNRENLVWAWTSFHASNWHPLTWMSHMLDCQLFGLKPRSHHLVNVFWHTASTVGLFLVLRRMTGENWRPALVAALFGLHPLHVESVAWVAERKDVLSTFFAVLTLGLYTRYAARPSVGRYLPVLVAFTLGLLAKPMLVTWPFVLLLMDYWPLRRCPISPALPDKETNTPRFAAAGWGRLLVEKLPLLLLAAACSFVTLQAQSVARKSGEHLPLVFRVENAVVAYATYLRKMVWPMDLAVFYQHEGSRLPLRPVLVSAGVLLLLTLLVVAVARRRPALLVGWLWYVGTLVPVIGLVQVGLQSMADRYTYLPLIGIFLAVVWCIPPLPESRPLAHAAAGLTAGTLLLLCTFLTFRQTLSWRNDDTLWHRVFRVADSPTSHALYSGVLYADHRVKEAKQQCRIALQMDSRCLLAWLHVGVQSLNGGDLEQAEAAFSQAVAVSPDTASLHVHLGRALACQGRNSEASDELRLACRLDPALAPAHAGLAVVLMRLGDWTGGRQESQEGRRLEPNIAEKSRQSAEEFCGNDVLHKKSPPLALFYAEQACGASETPRGELFQTLAKALALNDRPIAAYASAQRALALAEANGRPNFLPILREQLDSYRSSACQRAARSMSLALTEPTVSPFSGSLVGLSLLGIIQGESSWPLEIASR